MAKIPEHILNEIQDRCDIVEVISSYIPLKSAGRNFKANCPFHHEKTPSFVVSPDKQIYHCFGCNSGGNVFNFVKEYEKTDFIDAVKMLAQKTGVRLPEYKGGKKDDDSFVATLYSINDIAANFYANGLQTSKASSAIRNYLDKRALDEGAIKKFRLGYADASWNSFLDYLTKRGIKPEMSLKAGLVSRGKESSFYDLFRNRMIFPISDVRGRVLGFGARVLDDSLPKYINSPETAIYRKGHHLYGLNFAKSSIKEKGFAIITEGYLDVITAHQYGITNAISSLGTALTVEQIRLIRRYTHNVVMVYDSDQAGEMATLRGLDLLLAEGMHVNMATLDKGHDPDSFIRKFGPRGFNESIKKAKSLFNYKLDILNEKFDNTKTESKAEIVKEMLETISRVRNAVIKSEYIKKLAEILFIKEDAVWEELRSMKKGQRSPSSRDAQKFTKKSINISPAEKILIKLMLEDIDVINKVKSSLHPFDFKNPDVKHLIETLFSMEIEGEFIDTKKMMNCLKDRVSPSVISFIASDDMQIQNKEQNVVDCIKVIKKERRDERLKDIQTRLTTAHKNGSQKEAQSLLEEFNQLIKRGV